MACGAPTSISSGGRSAVQTSSGTPARSASTTAGCSSTAAVPLVVRTTAGSAVAERQAEGEEASAALVVVDVHRRCRRRRPGPAPAGWSATRGRPRRAHAVAHPLVDERGAEGGLEVLGSGRHRAPIRAHVVCQDPRHAPARRAPWARTPARAGARLHPDRSLLGPGGRRARRRPRADLRGRAGPRSIGCDRRRPGRRRPGHRRRRAVEPPTSATRWAPGMRCTWRSDHADLVRGLVLLGGTAGIEDDGRASRPGESRTDEPRRGSKLRGSTAFLDDWLRQPLFAGLPADRSFRAERRREHRRGPHVRASSRPGPGSQVPSWRRPGSPARCRCS